MYKEKVENILKEIKKINPDIICVQEATENCGLNKNVNTAEWLAKKLDYYCFYMPAHIFKEGNNAGNAILSRYPIERKISKILNKSKGVNTDYSGGGTIYLEADININGRIVTFSTAHLLYSPRFILTKEKESENNKLIEQIKKKKRRFIFSGDLNLTPESHLVKWLINNFKNCGPNFKIPTWTTKPFEYYGFNENKLRWRLDYVFVSKDMIVKSSKIIKTKYSDHLPILVELEIE